MGSPAQEAIALLIEMAERGEIDPWDVQVIAVIDRCLNELTIANKNGSIEEDLSQSGQAFLYASMLVLLKAETLANLDNNEAEENSPEAELLALAADENSPHLPLHLEKQLRRRAVAQPHKKRPVSLTELIGQLQQIAKAIEEKPVRVAPRRPRNLSNAQTVRSISQLAHQENLSETAIELEEFLHNHWPKTREDWLDFENLLDLWANRSISITPQYPSHHDRVGVFWALLLLSSQSKVELTQTEFYSDLKIRLITASESIPMGIGKASNLLLSKD